jgi:PQQ-like domain
MVSGSHVIEAPRYRGALRDGMITFGATVGPGTGKFSYRGGVRQQPARKVRRRTRRRALQRLLARVRRRAERRVLGRIRLGKAGVSPRLRRWVLALVLIGVALVPYPAQGAAGGAPAPTCRSGCRGGGVTSMVAWTRPLPGSWDVGSGLTGTVPAAGLAYVSIGHGVAALGVGLTVYAYSAKTGAPLWSQTLTGFPAGAAIVSVRTWPGEVTAGVSDTSAGHPQRTEVVLSDAAGRLTGRYPAALFGGAVGGSAQYTVIVGPTAVTSYDNATGRIRWQRPTGQAAQAWRTDGSSLYVAESASGFLGSAPVTALRRIDLATGAELVVQPLVGVSFPGTLSAAFDGVVLFSSAGGVTAYNGTTGAWMWFIGRAVPEGTDPRKQRIYLTEGSNLVGVNPLTGRITATASGSAVNGSAGVYVVRDGVALGLDQGAGGDAWGYDVAAQRVTLTAPGLPWPHYFVDPDGVGGSADPASSTVVIAACTQLGPAILASPVPPTPTASPTPTSALSIPGAPASGSASAPPGTSSSPPATRQAGQACLRPELVALSL